MVLESLSDASSVGVPGDTGCTAVVALLWVGEVEYICGPGPHQAAHQGEAPVGRALENGNEDVNEKESAHVDLYILGPVPQQAAHWGGAPAGLDPVRACIDLLKRHPYVGNWAQMC